MGNDSKGRRGDGGGGGSGKRCKQHYKPTPFFSLLQLVRFFFLLKTSKKIKKRNGQVLNKLQMRLLLKNPGGTLLQIQTVYIYSFTHRKNKGER